MKKYFNCSDLCMNLIIIQPVFNNCLIKKFWVLCRSLNVAAYYWLWRLLFKSHICFHCTAVNLTWGRLNYPCLSVLSIQIRRCTSYESGNSFVRVLRFNSMHRKTKEFVSWKRKLLKGRRPFTRPWSPTIK